MRQGYCFIDSLIEIDGPNKIVFEFVSKMFSAIGTLSGKDVDLFWKRSIHFLSSAEFILKLFTTILKDAEFLSVTNEYWVLTNKSWKNCC